MGFTKIIVERPDGQKEYDLTDLVLFLFDQFPQKTQEEFYKKHARPHYEMVGDVLTVAGAPEWA